MNLAFSVIAMEWFDKISEFMEGLPEWLQAHPRYGYLIVAGILLLWLVGIVCGWRWTYSRPGSWEGNFWLGTLGERSYRFWLGLIVAAATISPVAVLRNGISKRKAVLPSCEAESDAGEVRDNGRIPEIARSMPVLAVCYRQFCIVLHYSRTKEPFQGATTDRKVAGDTGR